MSKIVLNVVIVLCGIAIQFVLLVLSIRKVKKAKRIYEQALVKRKAAMTILDFADVWSKQMTEDERVNIVIEWHDRLAAANVIINMTEDEEL